MSEESNDCYSVVRVTRNTTSTVFPNSNSGFINNNNRKTNLKSINNTVVKTHKNNNNSV